MGTPNTSEEKMIYKANLHRVGAVVPESITLLEEYNDVQDWSKVKEAAKKGNLLGKASYYRIQAVLGMFKQRFVDEHKPLPTMKSIAKFITSSVSDSAKTQIMVPYFFSADALGQKIFLELVKSRYSSGTQPRLSADEVETFIINEQKEHPELERWSDYLKKRWSSGFLSVLRDFGFMKAAPSEALVKPSLRVETFGFFLFGLLDAGKTITEIQSDILWDYYLLSDREKEDLFFECQSRGWIFYAKAADIVELKPRYPSLEEWLDASLG
ncbi:MAG: DUF1819 family protein [Actinobacteria bacterium]|nr:DUF1819 family protein [Actinomycetota bacterium]